MIQKFTNIIPKGKKDENLSVDQQEFSLLCSITDEDYENQERLDEYNEKSRYTDILTYSDNKVELKSSKNYINASWIHTPFEKFFISTQGPIPTTIEDFWTMIFDYDVHIIVMLCNLLEDGVVKCADYWTTKMTKFTVTVVKEEKKLKSIVERKLRVSDGKTEKNVIQLHFTGWPDKGVPEAGGVFDEFENMFTTIKNYRGESPVVVHCSAGVGRTGTFISLYNMYNEILTQIHDDKVKEIKFSVFGLVRKLKEMRMFMVQSESQYFFIYYFIQMILQYYNNQ